MAVLWFNLMFWWVIFNKKKKLRSHLIMYCLRANRGRTAHLMPNTASHRTTLQRIAMHCNKLQDPARTCNTRKHTATYCNTLHQTCTWGDESAYVQIKDASYNALKHPGTHCNTTQRTDSTCKRGDKGAYNNIQRADAAAWQPQQVSCNTMETHRFVAVCCSVSQQYTTLSYGSLATATGLMQQHRNT